MEARYLASSMPFMVSKVISEMLCQPPLLVSRHLVTSSMKYSILLFLILFVSTAQAQSFSNFSIDKPEYPATTRVDQVDKYFGTNVSDPYRWLENVHSSNVHQWVQAENSVTQDYLSHIPYRDKLRRRIEQLLDYPRITAPRKVGVFLLFSRKTADCRIRLSSIGNTVLMASRRFFSIRIHFRPTELPRSVGWIIRTMISS